ncbi:MAG: response regulator [Proteobacteria bacterium]|nr:response regulator [Pseudomonadota bacterium]NDC23019.1 response regulator [Pseudomonadota bacterium]NDD04306.1 response regulator [Pseudomonadota bacterium]NDG26681.1 response regulator [Pseudomonadota bacterium]
MTHLINKKTILVVEDEPDILFSVKTFLESEGYKVFTATNGNEALEVLNKFKLPHLILLDMKMPVMNGWEFLRTFHNIYNHQAPVIIMTAAADAEQRAKEVQASSWIGKPFSFEDISEKIRQFN